MSKHVLNNTIWGIPPITMYRGVLIEKYIGGFKVLNKVVTTPEDVDKIIEQAAKELNKSIKQ